MGDVGFPFAGAVANAPRAVWGKPKSLAIEAEESGFRAQSRELENLETRADIYHNGLQKEIITRSMYHFLLPDATEDHCLTCYYSPRNRITFEISHL